MSEEKPRQRRSINFRVHALASSLFKGSQQYFGARYGLGTPEMRILSALGSERAMAASQLVTLTAMDKALVSRILNALHERGLLQASTPTLDARRKVWTLSRRGHALVKKLRPIWKQREAVVQACLTPEQRDLMEELLEKLFIASEAMRQEEAAVEAAKRPVRTRRDSSKKD